MKRDIILTCEYTEENQSFFEKLKNCSCDELKNLVYPLFSEVCSISFDTIENILIDSCSFKGGFVALTMNLNEEIIEGTEELYHSDMIMFLNIHAEEYNQDPEKQLLVFENADHEKVFSTQIYPVFLKDEREDKMMCDMSVKRLWALLMRLQPKQNQLKNRLKQRLEIKEVLKYR